VRAHGWLGWFSQEFPGTPVVVVVRHPVSAAASQRRLGEPDHLANYLDQPELVYDHLEPYRDYLESLVTPWEKLVGTWCVQSYLAFRTMDESRGTLVLLEDLLRRPAEEPQRLIAALRVDANPELLSRSLEWGPRATEGSIDLRTDIDRMSAVLDEVSADERRRALEIVEVFGLDAVYGDGAMPDSAAAHRLWAEEAVDGRGTAG
jgi:hypothetical protein